MSAAKVCLICTQSINLAFGSLISRICDLAMQLHRSIAAPCICRLRVFDVSLVQPREDLGSGRRRFGAVRQPSLFTVSSVEKGSNHGVKWLNGLRVQPDSMCLFILLPLKRMHPQAERESPMVTT
jgi:hypothetical protein